MISSKKSLIKEVAIVTVVLVLATSALNSIKSVALIQNYFSLIFAVLFLYVPVYVLHKKKRQIDFLDRSAALYFKSFIIFFIASIIVFPLFLIAVHFWEVVVYSASGPKFIMMPDLLKISAHQLIMVALPEEFFFRGYFQSTLNKVFAKRWRIFGADLGLAWIITALVFAVSHSVVTLRWWHFAIFFPALLFGYLRERTGSITAPILFHALSNIIMAWIPYLYRG